MADTIQTKRSQIHSSLVDAEKIDSEKESPKTKRRTKKTAEVATANAMTKADYIKLAKFRYAIRRFLAFSRENAEVHGLTPQQHQALLVIRGFPHRDTVTVGELAEQLCIRQNSTVELVDRLEALGLVRRLTSKDDRRHVLLTLTAAAESVLALLSSTNREEIRRLAPTFAALITSLTSKPKPATVKSRRSP